LLYKVILSKYFILQSKVSGHGEKAMQLNTDYWRGYFSSNQRNRPEPDWQAPVAVPRIARAALFQSLREFQLGDGGGPASLIAFDAESYRSQSVEIESIVDSWFNEEKEHSRLLGGLLQRFGVPPIKSHWSFSLFCALRKTLGVSFELQILTLTELVSTSYYSLLRKHCDDIAVGDVCGLILRDEYGHVRFHNARLAQKCATHGRFRQAAWRLQFRVCGYMAATVLWSSHGKCIRLLGGSTGEFYCNVRHQIKGFINSMENAIAANASHDGDVAKSYHYS
jgi:hypothetical protein